MRHTAPRPALRFAVASTFAWAFASAALADAPPPPPPPLPPPEQHEARVQVDIGNGDDTAAAVINALPPDVRAQLSADQIAAIIEREQKSQGGRHDDGAVAIVVPLGFFVCIIGVVAALLYAGFRKQRQLHETLRAMIEKGVDIPPALLVPPKTRNDRRRGTILTSVGIALVASLAMVDKDHSGIWALGFVPVALGVGYLIAAILDKRDAA